MKTVHKWTTIVWAKDDPPGLAVSQAPVLVKLRPGASPVQMCQYPLFIEATWGVQKHTDQLLKHGIIVKLQKPSGNTGWCRICKLQTRFTVNIHLVVPNPHTLIGLIPASAAWFTCLDLKDAFFYLLLVPITSNKGIPKKKKEERKKKGIPRGSMILPHLDSKFLTHVKNLYMKP
ncbi:hypothetical protein AAY473_019926 [Plecturocebus cupreus]